MELRPFLIALPDRYGEMFMENGRLSRDALSVELRGLQPLSIAGWHLYTIICTNKI